MIQTVVKIGGSLGQNHTLRGLMSKLVELGRKYKMIIVPGGGAFANAIREYELRFGLNPDAGHWMAVLAMDQYGHLLSSLVPGCEPVHCLADARKVLEAGRVPVLLTYNLLFQTDELPRSWDVTSDSIAAWVAGVAGARQLVLLKRVDGLFTADPEANANAALLDKISFKQLMGCGGVDRYFAVILKNKRMDVWVINGKYPERLKQLLDTGITKGTCVLQSDL